ncbi:hypothetical protein BC829DRAFT_397288 [Chytridium lagenaria]|nr:hypothetical protein BC829DRAFT_397288 [Chytridium lagenaria]
MGGLSGFINMFLPGFVLEQKDEMMFPTPWHMQWNNLWLSQTTLCILWLAYNRRWVPAWDCNKTSWIAKQFWVMLVTHGLFYIVEIYSTDIIRQYTPMSTNMNLLMVYNLLLLICGGVTFHNNVAVGPRHQPNSNVLSVSAMCISGVNYFTYCWSYRGSGCLSNRFNEMIISNLTHHLLLCTLLTLVLIGAVYYFALQTRKRWTKMGYIPPYARRASLSDSMEEGLQKSFGASTSTPKRGFLYGFGGRARRGDVEENTDFLLDSLDEERGRKAPSPPLRRTGEKSA